jgi:hypothetical protein
LRHLTTAETHEVRVALGASRERVADFATRSEGEAQAGYRERLKTVEGLQTTFAPGEKILIPFENEPELEIEIEVAEVRNGPC